MNAIQKMLGMNERAQRALRAELDELEKGLRAPGPEFSPEAVIKWFFSWLLCALGFVMAMTVVSTAAKLLKLLVP
jgi:hypothetical protein